MPAPKGFRDYWEPKQDSGEPITFIVPNFSQLEMRVYAQLSALHSEHIKRSPDPVCPCCAAGIPIIPRKSKRGVAREAQIKERSKMLQRLNGDKPWQKNR